MEGNDSSQREIATVSCQSSVGGQFLVTYDAPKRLVKEENSTSCLKMSSRSLQRNCKSFADKNKQSLEQSLLFQTSSTCLQDIADDSLENSVNAEMVESDTEDHHAFSDERQSNNKSFSIFKTPSKTSTPIKGCQTSTRDPVISKRLFDSIRKKFEKATKSDVPAAKIPKLTGNGAPLLKSFQSLPRLDKELGNAQPKKTAMVTGKRFAEVKPLKRPPIKLTPAVTNLKPKILTKLNQMERKTPVTAKVLPRTPLVKSDAKKPISTRISSTLNRPTTLAKDRPRSTSMKVIKKESDSSPPPEKSPLSPDSIVLQSLSERKKWTQSSDVKHLSAFTLYQLSTEIRNKTQELLRVLGIEQHQEIVRDSLASQIPVFKSSDPYTSATLRRLGQININLQVLETLLVGQDLSEVRREACVRL